MLERYTGCMLGLAIGDALGTPLGGLKAGHIQQVLGEIRTYVDIHHAFPDRPGKWRLPGLYSDDTQQALVIADVLTIQGGTDPGALADARLRLLNEGPEGAALGCYRGVSFSFRRALEMLRNADLTAGGSCAQPGAGVDAATWIAPVGLFYAADDDQMGNGVIDLCLPTHSDVRAIAAALAVARLAGWLASGEDPLSAAGRIAAWVEHWEKILAERRNLSLTTEDAELHQISRTIGVLPTLVRERNDQLAENTILELANQCGPEQHIAQVNSNFAPALVTISIYRALTANNFMDGVLGGVSAGGDADSAGAIAGALLGARFGEEAIPSDWIGDLMNAEQVRCRGSNLFHREVDWASWEDLVEMEREATVREMTVLEQWRKENKQVIEKRERRLEVKRQRTEAAKTSAEPGFAPPPEIWIGRREREPFDPETARREKAQRGRKRIGWKEDRRQKDR